jgi:hypothetical protein
VRSQFKGRKTEVNYDTVYNGGRRLRPHLENNDTLPNDKALLVGFVKDGLIMANSGSQPKNAGYGYFPFIAKN